MTMDFNKIDWSSYSNWEPVTLPTGGTWYIVPGTSWAYDPFMSAQTKRPQLFPNPKKSLEEQAKAKEELDKAQALAEKKSSLGYQALASAVPIGMTLGGKYIYDNYFASDSGEKGATGIGKLWDSLFGGKDSTPAAQGATAAPSVPAASNGATPAAAEGAGLTGPRSMLGGYSISDALGAAAATKGVYDSYQAFNNGGKGIRTGLAEVGGGIGSIFGGPIGSAIGAVGGNLLGYGLQKPKTGKGMLALAATAPFLLPFSVFGSPFHKSTKQTEQERWGELADKGITGAKEAFMSAHGDPEGKWSSGLGAGKEWNWEDAKTRALSNPSEFRGVYGNFDTFGNDWATYSGAQQDEIVRRLLNEGLYDPEKGDITISDKTRARQIKDEVLSSDPETSFLAKTQVQDPTTAITNPLQVKPPTVPTVQPNVSGVANPAASTNAVVSPVDYGKMLAERLNALGRLAI